jgi:hypothetical protein
MALMAGCNVLLGLGDKSVAVNDGGADGPAGEAGDSGQATEAGEAGSMDGAAETGTTDAGTAGTCGNGILDPGEACDPSAPDGGAVPACARLFGHGAMGTAKCASCTLDDSACTLPQLQAGSPWPMFGRTLTHSSRSSAHGPHAMPDGGSLQTVFRTTSGNVRFANPVIDREGTVYQGVVDYSRNDSGLWVHPRGAGTITSPSVALASGDTPDCGLVGALAIASDGTVYGQTGSGWLYAYQRNPDGGGFSVTSVQLSTAAPNCGTGLIGGPAIDVDGTVYVTFSDGLFSYTPSTGATHAVSMCPSAHYPPVIADDGVVYWEGYYGPSIICAYTPSTGAVNVSPGFSVGSTVSPAIAADGRIVLALSYVPGGIYAIAPPVESQTWDQLLDGGVFGVGPAIGADGTLYGASFGGTLYAIDPHATTQQNPRWATILGGSLGSSPVVDADGYTYVISEDGTLHATDPAGHTAWSMALPGGTADYNASMDADGTLYVGTGSEVFAINP